MNGPQDLYSRKPVVLTFNEDNSIHERLRYVVTDESGPDHNKHFVVEVHLNSNCIGKGEGHSKKLAEQQAAKEALALMGY